MANVGDVIAGNLALESATVLAATAFKGSVVETIDIDIDASGATIEFTLQGTGGTDLTVIGNDGPVTVDCSTALSVVLTAGSATVPKLNYIFLDADQVLTANTTGWNMTCNAPIAQVLVLDRATTNTYGALKVHAYTDHLSGTDCGHVCHIGKRIRILDAAWTDGVAISTVPALSASGSTLSFSNTSGTVYQMHPHAFPALNGATIGHNVINHPTTPYTEQTNLGNVTVDANNASLTNKHYSLVVWGVVSEKDGDCQLMVNLPTGSYTSSTKADRDADRFANYTIPATFAGTGFLIARMVVKNTSDTSWTMNVIEDLRGLKPSVSAGGGAGITSASDLSDYDTGTWTPEFRDHVGNILSSANHTYQEGTYTKIGNMVHISIRIRIAATYAPMINVNSIQIHGLPYSASITGNIRDCVTAGWGASLAIAGGTSITGYVVNSYITLKLWDAAGGISDLLVQEVSTQGDMMISGIYKV